jgi:GNAT superfamily N-acetyltransferase
MRGQLVEVRDLTRPEIETRAFGHLLWLSVEVDDHSLREIRDTKLPKLAVVGAVEAGVVVGFAAYDQAASPLVVEYIATAELHRGTGLGATLIGELQRRHPRVAIFAQTDDDAIGFYRKVGFVDTPVSRDARWPERQRYDCLLSPPTGGPEI